ncbi:ADL185Wp [Eremothecium gossypii ATCC 10895]|uniref:ADL185Wp n=1 Tax=Eremothecium gossypii (strain ATCC 10895 / CBS 109.51 / FGSC 9923 / NRRL Y-1056) TaxID=284811 RepID=Q75AV5_EREGS|nr:ADL185Wp [Eremothecium gossypii ATCC 10895]AAS51735.1 ADL185Wp [Eremothecium gossypii ATCC 10895]AEY96032.1 FADL185Wp [Eremothecium gossypii FDAG1]
MTSSSGTSASLPLLREEEQVWTAEDHIPGSQGTELRDWASPAPETAQKGCVKEVEYEGEVVRVYPADYRAVPAIRWQIGAAFVMFLILGINDQSTGSLMPVLTREYAVTKVQVALIFAVQCIAYTIGSVATDALHRALGMRGALLLAAGTCVVTYSALSLKPPTFYWYLPCFFYLGVAFAVIDSGCNVLLGGLDVHNTELLGMLHAAYGVASFITPPLANSIAKNHYWPRFFLVPLALSLVSFVMCFFAFRHETAAKYRYVCSGGEDADTEEAARERQFRRVVRNPVILLAAAFLFLYLGSEVSTGSWTLTYLLECKRNEPMAMSYVVTAYWAGLTLGRIASGFVSRHFFANEYRAGLFYACTTLAMHVLFMATGFVAPHGTRYFVVMALFLFLAGIFIGPLFPNCCVVTLQLLPKRLQLNGVSVAVALGSIGGAILPFAVGNILDAVGFDWFPSIAVVIVLMFNVIWWLYPSLVKF